MTERAWDQWHVTRYRFAAEYVQPGDAVVDAACGLGNGKEFFPGCEWVGVDRWETAPVVADLTTWVPDFGFDVWVGLETIEHLTDASHYVAQAKKATRAMVVSTPTVPTMFHNEWHLRDWTAAEVVGAFCDESWDLLECRPQVDGAGFRYGLFAFGRKGGT